MKKAFILILIFFVFCGANAQGQWSFGPRIGTGFSKNWDSRYYSNNIIGLFGEYRVKKSLLSWMYCLPNKEPLMQHINVP